MPKFFVRNSQIKEEKIEIVGEDVNHIVHVLRLKKQDEIQICDKDNGITYETQIIEIGKGEVNCKILKTLEQEVESKVQVTIFQGLPKADKMEYIIQKSTEIGGIEIIPVAMKRCIVKLEGKDENKKIERWQKIAEVAAKQSGRDRIPDIRNVMKFEQMKEIISDFDLFLVAYEDEKEVSLKQVLEEHRKRNTNVKKKDELVDLEKQNSLKIGIVIGPEGGIEKQEVEELKAYNAKVITLGNRILRTETASLVILSNIMYEFEV